MDTGCRENPFSSNRVEPARGGYIFPAEGDGLPGVLDRLEKSHWRGELVGAHGAGKSTLLTDICAGLSAKKIPWVRWQCSDRQRMLPGRWMQDVRAARVICIDGAERLMPGLLWLIRLQTQMRGKGLIVTLHRGKDIGVSITVRPDARCLNRKIEGLGRSEPLEMTAERVQKHRGDCREVLFDLYREFELTRGNRTE